MTARRRILGVLLLAGLFVAGCSSTSAPRASNPSSSATSMPASSPSTSAHATVAPASNTVSVCRDGTAYKAQILVLEHQAAVGAQSSFPTYQADLTRVFTTIAHDISLLGPQIPASLHADYRTVEAAYASMVTAISKATSLQSMEKPLQGLGTDTKLRAAANSLTAWVDSKCPSA
jgi:hypothetical protein